MRKLIHPDYDFKIDLSDGNATALFFDRADEYRHYVAELISQHEGNDGDFILSEDNNELSIASNMNIIADLFNIHLDDKRILSKLQTMLKAYVSEDMFQKTQDMISAIEMYAEEIASSFQYQMRPNPIDSASLLKLLGLQPEYDYQDDKEQILEYMNVFHDICGVGIFVIPNGFSAYNYDEIGMIADDSSRHGHSILFIEGNSASSYQKIPNGINKIVVDSDGAVIY